MFLRNILSQIYIIFTTVFASGRIFRLWHHNHLIIRSIMNKLLAYESIDVKISLCFFTYTEMFISLYMFIEKLNNIASEKLNCRSKFQHI